MRKNKIKDINILNHINFQKVKFDSKTCFLTVDENPINNIFKLDIIKKPDSKYASISITFDADLEVKGISDILGEINYNSKEDGEFSLQRDIGESKARIKFKGKKGNLLFFK